jgi:hypothetical protein
VVGLRFSVHVKGEVRRSPFGSVQELQGLINVRRDPVEPKSVSIRCLRQQTILSLQAHSVIHHPLSPNVLLRARF